MDTLFTSSGPAQKSVPPWKFDPCLYVWAAILRLPEESPPIHSAPAKSECFLIPLGSFCFGISYLALFRFHHISPPFRIVVLTLLISRSTWAVGGSQPAILSICPNVP